MAITKIPAAGFTGNNFRNIIINGDMSIAQRATTATGLGNGDNGYHTCDRWFFQETGSPTGEFTMSQDTDVPTGQGFAKSLKMDCTTAQGSLGSGDGFNIQQRFEGQNLQYLKKGTSSAESFTLSFWVKSNKTGTYVATFLDQDNTRQIAKSYTIDTANTWEKKTLTYAGDTTGTFDNDNGGSLYLIFYLSAGTDYTSGTLSTSWEAGTNANRAVGQVNLADNTANEWFITGVQLEAGTTASDFEFLPYDVNLQRCERYFRIHNTANGTCSSTTQMQFAIVFDPEMRASPSISGSGSILLTDFAYANYGFSSGVTYGINEGTNKGGRYNAGNLSGLTTGRDAMMLPTGTNSSPLEFDAEL